MADRRLLFARQGETLIPVDDHTREALRGWEEREPLAFKAPEGNIDMRKWRMMWALAQALVETGDYFDGEEAMSAILVQAKHCSVVVNPITGEARVEPKSFSPAFLSKKNRFERLFRRFLSIVEMQILPGIESEDLRRRIGEIMDGEQGRRLREQNARFGK